MARIEIRDRGAGMTPDFIQNQLYRPFHSTKADGFGIGAYEARSLVQAMGGRIELVSQLGEGSCFAILLPLARLVLLGFQEKLSANPIEFITRSSGDWTLYFLCITLCITPLPNRSTPSCLTTWKRISHQWMWWVWCRSYL